MTFCSFSIISVLSIVLVCDISSPTARVIWYSRFSRPLKYLFIRYCASLFLPPLAILLILLDMRVSRLSVKPLADTDIYGVWVCRAWNYLSRPDFLPRGFYDGTPNGISFSFASASKRFTRRAQFKPPWKRHWAATHIAPRSFAPDKALPSLPSCLSSLLAVACCRFMSPFCEYANSTLLDCSRSPVIRVSLRLAALPLASAPTVPAG